MRGLFFLTTVDAVNITQSKAIALLWTYPIINFIIVGYVINSRWVYDIWMLRLGGVIGRDLRKMMSRFVFIILVVVIIVYLIYISTYQEAVLMIGCQIPFCFLQYTNGSTVLLFFALWVAIPSQFFK